MKEGPREDVTRGGLPCAGSGTGRSMSDPCRMLRPMDTKDFWKLIDDARALVVDPADAEAVAERAAALLAEQ